MSDNLRYWSVLGKTDPKHTKSFQRAGGFRGTATKPIWTEYRLTETFGPCGIGWGMEKPDFQLVPAGDELLIYCTLKCWYIDNGTRAEVYGVGGDKVRVQQKSGLFSDDEAFKKAFTDAMGNAFKHVGAGADVHMGLFEDSKYLADVKREFAAEAASPEAHHRDPAKGEEPAALKRAEARAAYKRIKDALEAATTPKQIEALISVNADNLALIKEVHETSYDELMALSVARTNELLIAA